MTASTPFKVAIVSRGDRTARNLATAANSRFAAVFEALSDLGMAAEPAIFDEAFAGELRAQLLKVDAALVWVDPISKEGRRREALDALLREVAAAGVLVSGHPDVIARIGVKEVLHRTRSLGWGVDTEFYETFEAFAATSPARLADGPRVLKQNRGNGGMGVWKVQTLAGSDVEIQEAQGETAPRRLSLEAFIDSWRPYFDSGGRLVDQPFQARLGEGMIRCYLSGSKVAGFGRQIVSALMPPGSRASGPRIMSGPELPALQHLRSLVETDWTPGLLRLLDLREDDLPVIWDADFLYGPRTAAGEDSYVLCEINASSCFAIPEEAPAALAATLLARLLSR